jgi:DNA invertase Pin-like site-specific DNA recombinase
MIVRLYLCASTDRQHADRAGQMCNEFAIAKATLVHTMYIKHTSDASLERKVLMRLLGEAKRGEVLLVK